MIVTAQELSIMVKRPVDDAEAGPIVDMAGNIVGGYIGRTLTDNEPWRVKEAVLLVAARLLTDGGVAEVVSETIGSYTYRRAQGGHGSRFITPEVAALLSGYRGTAYTIDTPSPDTHTPAEWWSLTP